MTEQIPIFGAGGRYTERTISFADIEPLGSDGAHHTCRVFEPQLEEWAEPSVLPTGETGRLLYLFDPASVVELDPEDYSWDADHADRFVLDEQ